MSEKYSVFFGPVSISPRSSPVSVRALRASHSISGTKASPASESSRLENGSGEVLTAARVLVFLMAHPSVPAKDVKEFFAYIKANPGRLSYGSPGSGSSPALSLSGGGFRAAFFHLGELVEYGKTSEIFTNPREERTKDYITGRYG